MSGQISASRIATLVGTLRGSPAYSALARALRLLIADGRIPLGTRLPSERELSSALGLSRTTVTRAYAELGSAGYAVARQGSGTFTDVPGGRARASAGALLPGSGPADAIDLTCAAPEAPPGLANAYGAAVAELPAYFTGVGYFPSGIPQLREAIAAGYEERGVPTSASQILVTPGALVSIAAAADALLRSGDRAVVESPVYPNAVQSLRRAGARIVGVGVEPSGWDIPGLTAAVRQSSARVAYLIPDFQNPTGNLMTEGERAELGAGLASARTVAIVDESHQALGLDGRPMPRPFAAFCRDTVTVGGLSKPFWGGLRIGWLRLPHGWTDRFTSARLGSDLGAPILEQLVATRLLQEAPGILADQRARILEQRDALVAALTTELPDWRWRLPAGGLALWCELGAPLANELAVEAEARGLLITPGSVFAPEGGLSGFVRLPYTRPVPELQAAVRTLVSAWSAAQVRTPTGNSRRELIA